MGIFSKFERKVEDTFENSANRMFDAPISPVQIAKKAEKEMRREKMVGAGKEYAPTLYTVLVNDDDDERLFGYYPTLAGETETYLSAKAAENGLVMDGQPLVRFIADEGLKRGKFDVIAEPVAAPIIAQLRQEEMQRYGLAAAPAAQQPPRQQPQPQPAYQPEPQQGYPDDPYQAQPPQAYQQGDPQQMYQPDPYQAQPQDLYQHEVQQGQPQEYDPYAPSYQDSYDDPNQPPFDADLYAPQNDQLDEGEFYQQSLPYVPEDEIDRSVDYGEYTFNSEEFSDQQRERSERDSQPLGQDQHPAAQYQPAPSAASMQNPAANVPISASASPAAAAAAAALNTPETVVFAAGPGNAMPTPQASQVKARLINVTENRPYDLATARVILGRDVKNTIMVDDINASRTHAEIRLEPQGAWSITDLGSTNGTFVNGREITSQYLNNNDKITIGMTTFVFSLA